MQVLPWADLCLALYAASPLEDSMSVAEQLVQESRGGKDSIRLLYFGQKTSLIDAVLKRSDDVITSLRQ